MLNKSFNVFPLDDQRLIEASGQKFLSNTMPSVYVDEVTIENNGDDTSQVSVDLCFVQNVKEEIDTNWWFFSNSKRNKKYRVRLVACYGNSNGAALDFVAQRINEYQAEMMTSKGLKGAMRFVDTMKEYRVEGVNILDILNPVGPFTVDKITRLIKGSDEKVVTYGERSINDLGSLRQPLSDIVVMDVSALSALERDTQGIPNITNTDGIGKASLSPITFSVSSNLLLDNLSLYAFVYYDNTDENSTNSKSTIIYSLQTPSGFVDSRTVVGNKYVFEAQTKGLAPMAPGGMDVLPSDSSVILNDLRITDQIDRSNVAKKLSEDTLDPIIKMLSVDPNQKPTTDVIKNTNCFSDLWITRSDSDIKRFIFSYDIKSFLLKESSFPILYSKRRIADELLNGGDIIQDFERATVKYICLKKRQVEFESYNSISDIGTSSRNKKIQPNATYPEEIVTIPSAIGDVFLEDSPDGSVVFYQGVDACVRNRKTQSLAKFQYGVKISVTDPSLLYLRRVMLDLSNMSKQIQKIYDVIKNSPPAFVNEQAPAGTVIINGRGLLNRLGTKRIVPLSSIGMDDRTADDIVTEVINKYVSYAQKFELTVPSVTDGIDTLIGQSLYSLANSPKIESILEISSYIEKLEFAIERIVSAELPGGISTEGNIKRSTLRQKGFLQTKFVLLEKTHFFSNAIEYGKMYQTGYDYVNLNYDTNFFGIPQYTKTGLQNRSIQEFNKYFGEYSNSGAPARQLVPDGPYADSAFTFFTPGSIKVFGQPEIFQYSFVNDRTNTLEYNINSYARLFLDLIKLKKETQNHSPFSELRPKNLDTNLRECLMMEDCVVVDGITEEFEPYKIGNVVKKPADKQKQKTSKIKSLQKLSPDLFKMFLGGETDQTPASKNYFGLSDTPLKPKNFGQLDFIDKKALRIPKPSAPPTKLMFNILGEISLDPIVKNDLQYEKKSYNSLTALSNNIKVTNQNIVSLIEGDLANVPNQIKSMLVIASSADRLSLGEGFDAKRFLLEDQDISSAEKVITNIYDGDNFPPYKNAKDPMKVYAKFLTFWMNYKQIGVLEYLAGFENLRQDVELVDEGPESLSRRSLPIWKKLTADFFNNNRNAKLLCRVRNMSKEDIDIGQADMDKLIPFDSIDLFDLPIYNKYFMLLPEES